MCNLTESSFARQRCVQRCVMDHPVEINVDFTSDDLPHRRMKAMYSYWCQMRLGSALPPASAIDPLSMPRVALPWVSVLEVVGCEPRFRIRLQGTQIVAAVDRDYSWRHLDEMWGTEEQIERLEWCVAHGRPYLVESPLSWCSETYRSYVSLNLPFGTDTQRVSRIVSVFVFSGALF